MMWLLAAPGFLGLSACDDTGKDFLLYPTSDAPAVADYGELEVIPAKDWKALGAQAALDEYGYHGTIGPPESGKFGGGTFRFIGTGDDVCIFTDMELVFWGSPMSPNSPATQFAYPDNYRDDGDIDIFAGISAFYTGSPGVEMGDFYGVYTDSLGQQTTIAYNECLQSGAKTGFNDSHGGRGAPEFCTLETDQRDGVEFTVALNTFAAPLDDGQLDFITAVVGDSCNSLGITECTYLGEQFETDQDDYDTEVIGLENAYCEGSLAAYCCAHDGDYPDLCGEPPESGFCDQFVKK